MELTLKRLLLHQLTIKFNDQYAGNSLISTLGSLDMTMNRFQPDRWLFDINKVAADSVDFTMEIVEPGTKFNPVYTTRPSFFPVIVRLAEGTFKGVKVAVNNHVSGMKYANRLQHLAAKDLSVDFLKRSVDLGEVRVDQSAVNIVPGKKLRVPSRDASDSMLWTVKVGKAALHENRFSYQDEQVARSGGLDYAHLNTSGFNFEATDLFYSADSSSGSLRHLGFRDEGGFILDSARADIRLTRNSIIAENLLVKTARSVIRDNIQIRFADLGSILSQPGSTLVDARFRESRIALDDLFDVAPFTAQYFKLTKFRHTVINLNTEVTGTLGELYFPYFAFTGFTGTEVNGRGTIYNLTDPHRLSYDARLSKSFLPRADLLRFISARNAQLLSGFAAGVGFQGRLKGDLQSAASAGSFTSDQFAFNGTVNLKNISSGADFQYDIGLNNSRIKRSFLLSLVDTTTLPPNIHLPEYLVATGTLKGNNTQLKTNLKIGGSFGNLSANGFVTNYRDSERATYDLELSGDEFKLGQLLKTDTLFDKVTFKAMLRGRGLNYKTMEGTFRGDIANIEFNKHHYTNLGVNASFNQGHIESSGKINDSNLQLTYELTVNANTVSPGFSASLKLDTVLLKNLYFLDDTMKLSFSGIFRAENLDPYNLNVYASFDSGRVFYKNRNILLDSISVTARTIDQNTVVSVRSAFLDADANGRFSYKTIVPAIIQYIDQYYNITDSLKPDTSRQEIIFKGVVKNHPLFAKFFPGLKSFDDASFAGRYASKHVDSALNLVISAPVVQYGTKFFRNIGVSLASRYRQLAYNVAFDTLSLGKSTLFKTSLRGTIANDTMAFIAETLDSRDVPKYSAGGTLYSHDHIFSLTLSDSVLMNYEKWKLSPKNNISHSRLGLLVSDFVLNKDSASITAGSQQKIPNSPVDIAIDNFNMGDLTSALNRDTLLAEGLINARITVSDFNKKLPAITGTTDVNNFKVNQAIVGKLELSAIRQNENTIQGKITLSENNNDLTVNGYYCLDEDEQQFDATVDLKKLSVAALQGFSNGYIVRSSGSILGQLDVKGKFTRPEWKGNLNFDSATFTIPRFGTTYLLNKQALVFDFPAICFENFTILDTVNHPLIINGDVISRDLFDYNLALDIRSRDFSVVNAPKAINNLIYGYAAIDANTSITGTSKAPKLAGEVYFNQHTDLTIVLPEKNTDKDAARSLVTFIDRDTFSFTKTRDVLPVAAPVVNFKKFVNYNLNLRVDKKAALTIVIDPSSGDVLKVGGNASINPGVDAGGNLLLAGDYLLDSGFYSLNYQFLSKQFALMKNSKIQFAGEPMDAKIDLTAEYITNTSPRELLGNEVGSVDPKFAYSFNHELPFRVMLYMKGSLRRPVISFDVRLAAVETISANLRTTIENKLNQLRGDVAATNKQVFALLGLGRFVGEQSIHFFKGTGRGGSFDELARESVSEFLSSALDQIASDLFKGINIDLNLNSYKDFVNSNASKGNDLNVEVSKNFLNDRLNVTVGKNFGIEGQDGSAKAAQQKGSRFLPDVTVNYKLSQDGKYRIRAYNKNQFEVILDGYIVETGLGFIVTMDYDKYQELFVKKKVQTK